MRSYLPAFHPATSLFHDMDESIQADRVISKLAASLPPVLLLPFEDTRSARESTAELLLLWCNPNRPDRILVMRERAVPVIQFMPALKLLLGGIRHDEVISSLSRLRMHFLRDAKTPTWEELCEIERQLTDRMPAITQCANLPLSERLDRVLQQPARIQGRLEADRGGSSSDASRGHALIFDVNTPEYGLTISDLEQLLRSPQPMTDLHLHAIDTIFHHRCGILIRWLLGKATPTWVVPEVLVKLSAARQQLDYYVKTGMRHDPSTMAPDPKLSRLDYPPGEGAAFLKGQRFLEIVDLMVVPVLEAKLLRPPQISGYRRFLDLTWLEHISVYGARATRLAGHPEQGHLSLSWMCNECKRVVTEHGQNSIVSRDAEAALLTFVEQCLRSAATSYNAFLTGAPFQSTFITTEEPHRDLLRALKPLGNLLEFVHDIPVAGRPLLRGQPAAS